ncbi:BRC1 protein, partial [Pseudoatta argentina]
TCLLVHLSNVCATYRAPKTPTKVVTPVCLVLPPGLLAGSGASDEFRCEPCNKNLTSLTRLKRHIQNVHTRPSKEPICNICKRVYSSLNSLRNHKSIYHRQHNKNEQQRKEVAQAREWQRDQIEHTDRNYSAQQQQQQQQQHQTQQHSRMG